VDQVDLAGADILVHDLAIGGDVEGFACRALKIAEDFHGHGRAFRAEGLVGSTSERPAGACGGVGRGATLPDSAVFSGAVGEEETAGAAFPVG